MKRYTLFLLAALFAAVPAAFAQVKYVAVVNVEIDRESGASDDINSAEAHEITAALRREAVKNLPSDKYSIMTSETVQAQGGAVLEECAEENCVVILGSKIGADYVVRGIVRKFKTQLTLTVETYEIQNGTLVASSDPVRFESAAELLEKAADASADMYKTFAGFAQKGSRGAPLTGFTLGYGYSKSHWTVQAGVVHSRPIYLNTLSLNAEGNVSVGKAEYTGGENVNILGASVPLTVLLRWRFLSLEVGAHGDALYGDDEWLLNGGAVAGAGFGFNVGKKSEQRYFYRYCSGNKYMAHAVGMYWAF